MKPEDLQELKNTLFGLKSALEKQLASSEESTKPVDLGQPIGRLSRMDAMQQQSMAKTNRQAAQRRLKQVESALTRLEKNAYGFCLECEEEIAFARLKAKPETLFCIDCQSRREI